MKAEEVFKQEAERLGIKLTFEEFTEKNPQISILLLACVVVMKRETLEQQKKLRESLENGIEISKHRKKIMESHLVLQKRYDSVLQENLDNLLKEKSYLITIQEMITDLKEVQSQLKDTGGFDLIIHGIQDHLDKYELLNI